MATFRKTLSERIAAWKAANNVKLCPQTQRLALEAELREEWGPGRGGLARLSPEARRAIASRGGKTASERGTAHRFTSEEARKAGALGGASAHRSGKAHRFTSEEARAANRNAQRSPTPPQPIRWVYGLGVGDQPPEAGATLYLLKTLAVCSVKAPGHSLWRARDPEEGEAPKWTLLRAEVTLKGS
jgi:hypothetical protein